MFERYTNRARLAIYHARYEATRRQRIEIEPVDILLGLTVDAHQPHCPFEILHLNARHIRDLLDPDPIYGPANNKDIGLSAESKKALAYADFEGRRDKRYAIGSDHLLRGVLRLGGETARKMAGAGYGLEKMRRASREAHRLNADAVAPAGWKLRTNGRLWLFIIGAVLFLAALLYLRSQN